ncbi:MAG: VF530 family protein [Pseudomonadota bacterium]|nr:VF530 family protein [Pseudomonadota bacterium]
MPGEQPKNPLHGLTLGAIVTELVETYGWEELGRQVKIQCFLNDPSVASSLKFLRKTPWAREKVESYYLWHLREQKRTRRAEDPE